MVCYDGPLVVRYRVRNLLHDVMGATSGNRSGCGKERLGEIWHREKQWRFIESSNGVLGGFFVAPAAGSSRRSSYRNWTIEYVKVDRVHR